jgi:hypothetical protein
MAFSYVDYTVSVATPGPFSFAAIDGYITLSHIKVYQNGTLLNTTQYTIDGTTEEVTLDTSADPGDVIRIRRETPNLSTEYTVPFQDGSILRSRDLRLAQSQALYISQEFDDFNVTISGSPDSGDILSWNGTEYVFIPPGSLGLADGTYGDIVVTNSGSSWAVKDGIYGDISVSSGGSSWTFTGSVILPPDGTYGDVVVSGSGTVWTVTGLSTTLNELTNVNAPSPTDGQVLTWDNTASEWQAKDPTGGLVGTIDGGDATSTYLTSIDGGTA